MNQPFRTIDHRREREQLLRLSARRGVRLYEGVYVGIPQAIERRVGLNSDAVWHGSNEVLPLLLAARAW